MVDRFFYNNIIVIFSKTANLQRELKNNEFVDENK